MGIIENVERGYLRTDIPGLRPGNTVVVNVRIKEGDKERVQAFEGIVIALRGRGIGTTFTVRKVSYGVGVERVFPLHSPSIESVKVLEKGVTRKARLYYLRGLTEKVAKRKIRGRQ